MSRDRVDLVPVLQIVEHLDRAVAGARGQLLAVRTECHAAHAAVIAAQALDLTARRGLPDLDAPVTAARLPRAGRSSSTPPN